MSLDLSLWNIEAGLVQLMQMREETLDACIVLEAELSMQVPDTAPLLKLRREELVVIDAEIRKYVQSEVKKVDAIRAVWKTLQMLEINAQAEAELQHQRALSYRRNLDRLKECCREVMESMPWKPGKPKRIEGGTGALLLKGNGGKQAVLIADESLVPDEFCVVTVTMSAAGWNMLQGEAERSGSIRGEVMRVPSLSLIGEALQRNCESCRGSGLEHKEGKLRTIDERGEDGGGVGHFPCLACGGSGKQGVPGCSLAPRASHVEIR